MTATQSSVVVVESYKASLLFRIAFAVLAMVCAIMSPLGALLATVTPPATLSQLLPGAVIGGSLAAFFIYLAVRSLRYRIELTEDSVGLCGLLWTTRIPLARIGRVSEEDYFDEGVRYKIHIVRDLDDARLFPIGQSFHNEAELVARLSAVAEKNVRY